MPKPLTIRRRTIQRIERALQEALDLAIEERDIRAKGTYDFPNAQRRVKKIDGALKAVEDLARG